MAPARLDQPVVEAGRRQLELFIAHIMRYPESLLVTRSGNRIELKREFFRGLQSNFSIVMLFFSGIAGFLSEQKMNEIINRTGKCPEG